MRLTPFRHLLIGLVALGLAAGCTSGPPPVDTGPTTSGSAAPNAPEPTAPEPSASATTPAGPAADAIRHLDPAGLDWQWFESHSQITAVDVTKPDRHKRTYTIGKPVYSDANADGLEDMAVSIAQLDGNGYREQWHIWLAGADGTPEQVTIPIAWTVRCGDGTSKVTATKGGFKVVERLREPVIDDHLPCSSPGTFKSTRRVGVERVGELPALVNLDDRRGYGGVCPTQQRTETGRVKVWGGIAPTNAAPLTIDGKTMYMILTHPHGLTQNADPMRLVAVWPAGGNSDDRICVWTDPGRYESS
ncbi:hypothetical protein [Micropruina sonneratiae]|uniref:hypothetical protein n=1 Tax=Micropruina sonneratiae TaxID=2986940 RepID=UPI002227FA70|nr:hypothetical protein [Micropruina sp. KQZ13P-5]MCW3158041.1 hypothetical protein [Micropruina sp. KQZ13P-5]